MGRCEKCRAWHCVCHQERGVSEERLQEIFDEHMSARRPDEDLSSRLTANKPKGVTVSEERIQELFDEQRQWLGRCVDAFAKQLEEANRLSAEALNRNAQENERTAKREVAYDERTAGTEERAERQTLAWEKIAEALSRMSGHPASITPAGIEGERR
jgi:hypothetical protein